VEQRGALDVANRLLQRCAAVFRYALQTGRTSFNPATDLSGALKVRKVRHQPSLPRAELPEFFKRLNRYESYLQTVLAMRLLILTFVRPGELRGACWCEFDQNAREWRIPGERMKMKTEHIVPLSRQVTGVSPPRGILSPLCLSVSSLGQLRSRAKAGGSLLERSNGIK